MKRQNCVASTEAKDLSQSQLRRSGLRPPWSEKACYDTELDSMAKLPAVCEEVPVCRGTV